MANENEETPEFETLRKPLAPIPRADGVEDDEHKKRMKEYEDLFAEFNAIKELSRSLDKLSLADKWNCSKLIPETPEERTAKADEHERRFSAYEAAREDYNRRNYDFFIETIIEWLKRHTEKDKEHDSMLFALSTRLERLGSIPAPMWLKVLAFLNLILSATAIGMVLMK